MASIEGIIDLLCSILMDHSQNTAISNHKSTTCFIISGVPQGSVIDPCPFVISINDIGIDLTNSIYIYADHTKISCQYPQNSITHHITHVILPNNSLQISLNHIDQWSRLCKLLLNMSNCSIITFSPAHQESSNINILMILTMRKP
jgi:Reverse transcriptase (RNA-dependent DNA polymerase)